MAEAPKAERPERAARPERAERSEGRSEGRSSRSRGRGRGEREPRPAPLEALPDVELPPIPTVLAEAPPSDIWVELPSPGDEAPKKARRPRTRGRKADASTGDAVIETVAEDAATADDALVEAPVVVAPEVLVEPMQIATPEPLLAPVQEPAPEPIPVSETVVEPAQPDPAEITTPPAKPRGGWWRRG